MELFEQVIARFLAIIMPIDIAVFIVILILLKKIKKRGSRILLSLILYFIVSEFIKYLIDGKVDIISTLSIVIGLAILGWFSDALSNETVSSTKQKKDKPSDGYGCPSCFSEYLPEFEICADCNVKLIKLPNR